MWKTCDESEIWGFFRSLVPVDNFGGKVDKFFTDCLSTEMFPQYTGICG